MYAKRATSTPVASRIEGEAGAGARKEGEGLDIVVDGEPSIEYSRIIEAAMMGIETALDIRISKFQIEYSNLPQSMF